MLVTSADARYLLYNSLAADGSLDEVLTAEFTPFTGTLTSSIKTISRLFSTIIVI